MRYVLALLLSLIAAPVFAYDANSELPNAADEARARDLFRELRCMVCQNQSIDDSDAPLAKDLRALVRERVSAGDSSAAIKTFLVARYGQFVLLQPGLSGSTLLLWMTPFAVLLVGGGAAFFLARRRKPGSRAELSAEERQKLAAILRHD